METNNEFDNISGIIPKEDKISDESVNDLKAFLKENIFENDKKIKNHYTPKKNKYNQTNKICKNIYTKQEKNEELENSLDLGIQEKETKDTNTDDKSEHKKNNTCGGDFQGYSNILDENQCININKFIIVNDKNNIKKDLNNYEDKLMNLIKINSSVDYKKSKFKIDFEFDLDKKYNYKLIGKKRSNENKNNTIENDNEKIFNNIYNLYKKYKGNGPDYKILEQQNGLINKIYTIIENNIPISVIYFQNKLIEQIYLIIDQMKIDDNSTIFEVLTKIETNIRNYKSKYPLKFQP